jgi:hypothetical protein
MYNTSVFVLADLAWLYQSKQIGATKKLTLPLSLSIIAGLPFTVGQNLSNGRVLSDNFNSVRVQS